jgi:hypothetical protein
MDASNVMNGTYGEVWIDSDKVGECTALQAKVDKKKEDVLICGQPGTSKKVVGWDGKGSIKMHKTTSRMALKTADSIKSGKDLKCTIISKLADPAAIGAERVILKYCSFDDLTLADWAAGKSGETDCPFTFEDFELVDTVTP